MYNEALSPTDVQSLSDAMFAGEQYPFTEPEEPSIRTGTGGGVTALVIAEPEPVTEPTEVEPKEEPVVTFLDDLTPMQKFIGAVLVISLGAGGIALYTSRMPKVKRRRKK